MRYFTTCILLCHFFVWTNVHADYAATFDAENGELHISEIKLMPIGTSYSAMLKQVDLGEFIFKLVDHQPVEITSKSPCFYEIDTGIVSIPAIQVGDRVYEVKLSLLADQADYLYQITEMSIINGNAPNEVILSQTSPKIVIKTPENNDTDEEIVQIYASDETETILEDHDRTDDPAIWLHPEKPLLSTIIGTHKIGGIAVYSLQGRVLQFIPEGKMNNVDLRYNFPLNGKLIDLVAVSDRGKASVLFYKVQSNRLLKEIGKTELAMAIEGYGLCMYHSPITNKFYVFINDTEGMVEQLEIIVLDEEQVSATLVRNIQLDSQPEGCVADDVSGKIYIGEESRGIWKFSAEPEGENTGILVDEVIEKGGHMTPDVEGLSLYYTDAENGYLVASNQGNHTFSIYERAGDNQYLGKFTIANNPDTSIDHAFDTDGVDIINVPLGKKYPFGLLVVQDGLNLSDDATEAKQNFKLISWENIADKFSLSKDTTYDPRNP